MNFHPLAPHPLSGISQRVPPSNLQAETAVLGALLANNKAYARVADYLLPEHFADPWHGRIYAEIQRLIELGGVADVVTVRPKFENEVIDVTTADEEGVAKTKNILAPYYLSGLLMSMVGIINAGEYGRVIYDCWLRRQVIDAGEIAVNAAFGGPGDADEGRTGAEIATDTAEMLLGLADPKQAREVVSVGTAVQAVIEAASRAAGGEKPKAVPTRLPRLDQMLAPRGLAAPQFIVVGARPSMGKTAFAGQLALSAARHRVEGRSAGAVLVFSMEMGADELAERWVANVAKVDSTRIAHGDLDQDEWGDVFLARDELMDLPLIIDDRAALTLGQIRMRARSVAARQPLSLIVIDYLQLMGAPPEIAKQGLTAVTTHLSTGLKQIAKDLKVPVVALSQLSREVEKRDDKRPMLSDLRQSGSIEQDADVVMFLYRDAYYVERDEPKIKPDETDQDFQIRHAGWKASLDRCQGLIEVNIAKQRRGPIGTAHLRFDGATSRIWQEGDGHE